MKALAAAFFTTALVIGSSAAVEAEVVLRDTSGHSTSLSSLQGKWLVINYWASWCTSCIAEIPELNRFYKQHKNDTVALFAVNYDALSLSEQNRLIKKLGIQYPNLQKDPANDLNLGGIRGVPVTFIFNPDGRLIKTLYGGQTAKRLSGMIERRTHS